jgi:hypothetical protein
VCWRAIAQARRERSRPSRPLHRPRQLLQRSGNAAAGLLRPRNQVTVVAPRQPSAIRCLPWQPAERSTKSLPLVRGLARTMSARPSPGTSGQAASKSATGSYTQAKRQRRRNTQRSDSAVNGRSRSSVTADRQVELTAAVSLAATTGGLFFLADEGQDEGAAGRRGAVLQQEDALPPPSSPRYDVVRVHAPHSPGCDQAHQQTLISRSLATHQSSSRPCGCASALRQKGRYAGGGRRAAPLNHALRRSS